MESRQVHVDVINKLWQVYSKYGAKSAGTLGLISALAYSNPARELPKQQRRGTVIILGMLAVASPKIVETRREDLIRIGLGARGKVSRLELPMSMTEKRSTGGYDISQVYVHRPGKAEREREKDQRSVGPRHKACID